MEFQAIGFGEVYHHTPLSPTCSSSDDPDWPDESDEKGAMTIVDEDARILEKSIKMYS